MGPTYPLRTVLFVTVGVFYLSATWLLWHRLSFESPEPLPLSTECSNQVYEPKTTPVSQKFRHVAIASSFGFHHDVYMTVAWTLSRLFASSTMSGSVEVFAHQPFGYGFGRVVEDLGLFNGTVHTPDEMIESVNKGKIDMLILGTCEIDLRGKWNQELLKAWDARPADNKFELVCIVHHVGDTAWQPAITPWAARESIRLLTISEHVKTGFERLFGQHADAVDQELRLAGYENIPVDVHVPILDVESFVDREVDNHVVLSKAVIQGSFDTSRRDYIRIFQELNESLHEDPTIWGYLPLSNGASYTADPLSPHPFHLYLIGSGSIQIPIELKNVVSVHTGLDYVEFYRFMSTMDICLPAFAENGYYESQASSTFAMAIECDVPILVTRRMQRSYTYVDESVTVVRPAIVREIAALRVLRSGNTTQLMNQEYRSEGVNFRLRGENKRALDDMLRKGWYKPYDKHRRAKERIWKGNERVMEKLLKGLA